MRTVILRQVLLSPRAPKWEVEIDENEEVVCVNWVNVNHGSHQVWIARWEPRHE